MKELSSETTEGDYSLAHQLNPHVILFPFSMILQFGSLLANHAPRTAEMNFAPGTTISKIGIWTFLWFSSNANEEMMVEWVAVTFVFSCGVEIWVDHHDDHDDDGGDVLVMFSNHYLFVFSLFACWFVWCTWVILKTSSKMGRVHCTSSVRYMNGCKIEEK